MKRLFLSSTLFTLLVLTNACQTTIDSTNDSQTMKASVSPRINHVYLAVADLEKSVAFYTKAFDLEVTNRLKKLKRTAPDGTVSEIEVNMAFLKFPGQDFVFEIGQRTDYKADNTAPSFAHVGVDVKDIEAASERLLAAGATLISPVALVEAECVSAKNAFFSGPDGETIELMQLISGEF